VCACGGTRHHGNGPSSVPALVGLWRAGGGSVRQQLRCDEAPSRASVYGGVGHYSCLGEAEPEYRRVSPTEETVCVAEKKIAAFARRWGMQWWPRQVGRP
jgi:hypothetical protein